MTTTVSEILRQIEGSVTSMSEARRIAYFGQIKVDDIVVQWIGDEVEVKEGTRIAVGKREWICRGERWEPLSGGG